MAIICLDISITVHYVLITVSDDSENTLRYLDPNFCRFPYILHDFTAAVTLLLYLLLYDVTR